MTGGGGVGIPPLNLSFGPAVSDAQSGGGTLGTGAFNFKQPQAAGIVQTILPYVALGGIVWLLTRK